MDKKKIIVGGDAVSGMVMQESHNVVQYAVNEVLVMLNIDFDRESRIAVLRPESALSEEDFVRAATVIDPVIKESGNISGLVIYTESFPGWDTFGAMMGHFKFVRNHHKKIAKVAIVTNSKLGDFAERVASHFISAQIRHFPYDDLDRAKIWILGTSEPGG